MEEEPSQELSQLGLLKQAPESLAFCGPGHNEDPREKIDLAKKEGFDDGDLRRMVCSWLCVFRLVAKCASENPGHQCLTISSVCWVVARPVSSARRLIKRASSMAAAIWHWPTAR
jgi:hypothetical protein